MCPASLEFLGIAVTGEEPIVLLSTGFLSHVGSISVKSLL